MSRDADLPLVAAEPASDSTQSRTASRWPAIYSLATAWICPATTTQRTRQVTLVSAFGVHILAVLLALIALVIIGAMNWYLYRSGEATLLQSIFRSFDDFLGDLARLTKQAKLAILALAAAIEGGLILLATLLMPWGARDEPAADSFRHALRRTWLHGGHAAFLILVVGIALVKIDAYRYNWHQSVRERVQTVHPGRRPVGATPEELAAYDRQVFIFQQASQKQYNNPPYLVKHDDEAMSYIVILACIWFLWALLRGLGADRPVRTPEHPPMCRACGYNLTGLPPDGRCPECGRPVADSIGPDASPGPAWERPADPSGGYLRTLYAWMWSAPTEASDLRLTPARRRHPTFLLINVILCGLAAGIGIALIFWWDETSRGRDFDREILTLGAPITGSIWSAFVLLFAAGAAFVPGMVMLARDRRNLLSGTFQAACYCSGWLLAWTAVGVATLAVTVLRFDDLIKPIAQSINVRPHLFAPLINLTVHAACGLLFVVTVYRASAGVRYACR